MHRAFLRQNCNKGGEIAVLCLSKKQDNAEVTQTFLNAVNQCPICDARLLATASKPI